MFSKAIFSARIFYEIKMRPFLVYAKRLAWNRGIRLWWCRLWIRGDEFHWTLNTDHLAMIAMGEKARKKYYDNLMKRRNIAHERDLSKRGKRFTRF